MQGGKFVWICNKIKRKKGKNKSEVTNSRQLSLSPLSVLSNWVGLGGTYIDEKFSMHHDPIKFHRHVILDVSGIIVKLQKSQILRTTNIGIRMKIFTIDEPIRKPRYNMVWYDCQSNTDIKFLNIPETSTQEAKKRRPQFVSKERFSQQARTTQVIRYS